MIYHIPNITFYIIFWFARYMKQSIYYSHGIFYHRMYSNFFCRVTILLSTLYSMFCYSSSLIMHYCIIVIMSITSVFFLIIFLLNTTFYAIWFWHYFYELSYFNYLSHLFYLDQDVLFPHYPGLNLVQNYLYLP